MLGRMRHGPSSEPLVSIVFPGYNPGAEIESTWQSIRRFLHDEPGCWEIIFVCDGCTDGSPARLEELTRSESERVRVLSYAPNRGKGFAVRHGLAAATGDFRIFTDIDLAYPWDDVLRVVKALRAGADMVIASRQHPESRVTVPAALQGYVYRRYLQSQVFAGLAHLLLPITQPDSQAGLKGMTASVAARLLPHLQCDGFCFDCDLLTGCKRFGIPVHEVPVNVHYHDQASTTGLFAITRMVRELWRIRRRWQQVAELPLPRADAGSKKAA